jgi:signal transduction histidine kinase
VAAGRRDALAEPRGAREVVRAARAFNAMTQELAAREADLSSRVEQLERATRELRAAQNQLVRSEKLAMVGRLSAGIAHEVGNPLAAIVGLTDVLKEGGLEEGEVRDFADRIGREAQRIHRTVRELLDYARAAPERSADGEAEEGEVGDAVAQVVRLLGPQKAMRGVSFAQQVQEGIPRVRVATDRLVQVLLNLVLNAVDAARGGEGGSERAVAVTIRAAVENGRVVLEVEDDGPGIAPEVRAKVFEPFFTTKPAGAGTGLGLAICAVIVEQAGGLISALDRRDGARGARLRIELPIGRERLSQGGDGSGSGSGGPA